MTYDFTGTVTTKTGIYASAGAAVSGTYTIDPDAGTASQTVLPVTFSGFWAIGVRGGAGPGYGDPVPAAIVFGSTVTSGGVSYLNSTPSPFGVVNCVEGQPTQYATTDEEWLDANTFVVSGFSLTGAAGASSPFDAEGLPLFANSTSAVGDLVTNSNGRVVGILGYTITSLTPVPLPSSALLLLGGLSAFGVASGRGRHRAARMSRANLRA